MGLKDYEKVRGRLQIMHIWAEFALEKDLNFFNEKHLKSISEWTLEALELLKEWEERKRRWLQCIAENQLSVGKEYPKSDYEKGKWDGLEAAYQILTEET